MIARRSARGPARSRRGAAVGALLAAVTGMSVTGSALVGVRALHAQDTATRQRTASARITPVTTDSTRITLALWRTPLADALAALVDASGMSLLFDASVLRDATTRLGAGARVSCRVESQPPEAMLRCIVREAGLDYYRLSSGTYVVIARPEAAPRFGQLTGVVVDAGTGEPLPFATVQLVDHPTLRISGDAGQFAFPPLAPGRYRVLVRALGYAPIVADFALQPDALVRERIALERQATLAAPLVINGLAPTRVSGGFGDAIGDAPTSTSATSLSATPAAVFLPGAPTLLGLTRHDGVGDLHLQGGEAGEHLWRLDGAPVFDAAAFSGIFGSFVPLAISELRVRRAGFGVTAGSFTAGVIDLTHDVGASEPGVAASVDPLAAAARVALPIPVGGRKAHVMIAARTDLWGITRPSALEAALRAWNAPDPVLLRRLDVVDESPESDPTELLDAAKETRAYQQIGGPLDLRLRDVHVAARVPLSAFTTMRASAYVGTRSLGSQSVAALAESALRGFSAASAPPTFVSEGIAVTRDDYAARTLAAQVRLDRLVGARLLTSVQARISEQSLTHDFAYVADSGSLFLAKPRRDGNHVREVALATTATWSARGPWTLDIGAEVARADARLDLRNGVTRAIDREDESWRAAAYGELQWQLGANTWLDLGSRATFLPEVARVVAEPRVALRREGESDRWGAWAFRLAGGVHRQFISQFDVATTTPVALMPSVRFWLPVTGTNGIPTAYHVATEMVATPAEQWEIRAEAYWKWQPTILAVDYGELVRDEGVALPGDMSSSIIAPSRGEAAGAGVRIARVIDLSGVPLLNDAPTLRIDAGYDAGLVQRTFPSRFGGRRQAAPWTEPHRASLAFTLRPRRGVIASWRTRGVWGRPWALRQSYYDLLEGTGTLPTGTPGDDIRPALVETDVGISVTQQVAGWRVELGASVTNLFDRENVLDYALRRRSVTGEASFERLPRLLPGRQPMLQLRILP